MGLVEVMGLAALASCICETESQKAQGKTVAQSPSPVFRNSSISGQPYGEYIPGALTIVFGVSTCWIEADSMNQIGGWDYRSFLPDSF